MHLKNSNDTQTRLKVLVERKYLKVSLVKKNTVSFYVMVNSINIDLLLSSASQLFRRFYPNSFFFFWSRQGTVQFITLY